jgi:hypothetical protein
MRHVLWLGLSFTLGTLGTAQAQQLAPAQLKVHLAHDAPKLQLAEPLATFALTPPCLGCRAGLRSATQDYAPEPPAPVPAARPAPPVKKPTQYAIGDAWKFRGGRVLSIRLTPTPEECAPLVRLSF